MEEIGCAEGTSFANWGINGVLTEWLSAAMVSAADWQSGAGNPLNDAVYGRSSF